MNTVAIQLKDGKKIVEKIEISSGSDLVHLYNALKGGIIFNPKMSIPRSDERTHDTDGDLEAQALRVSGSSMRMPCTSEMMEYLKIHDDLQSVAEDISLKNIDTTVANMDLEVMAALEEVKRDKCSKLKTNCDKDSNRESKNAIEGFFIMKCSKCGKVKCFNSNTDTLFHCECGETYSTSDYVKVYGRCPNCSNNIGVLEHSDKIVATLVGMDITEGMICRKCKSPVNFRYNEVKKRWEAL